MGYVHNKKAYHIYLETVLFCQCLLCTPLVRQFSTYSLMGCTTQATCTTSTLFLLQQLHALLTGLV
jgi:hypothetical protein